MGREGLKLAKSNEENSPNKIILRHLNIGSLRNLDILLSETKLDNSFPSAQFISKGCGIPYRLDKTQTLEDCYFVFVRIYPPSS